MEHPAIMGLYKLEPLYASGTFLPKNNVVLYFLSIEFSQRYWPGILE